MRREGMESVLQYWDDLDDLVGAARLSAERIRRLILFVASTLAFVALTGAGVALAFREPPLAMAAATLLFVSLMYRSVTGPRPARTGS